MKTLISPSILSADKNKLQQEVNEIEKYADWLHVDVMDGRFVPPITFTPKDIKQIKTSLKKDVHLMVEHPLKEGYIDGYLDAGAAIITIHEECKDKVSECLNYIKVHGAVPAISIKPATPLEKISDYLSNVGMVLVMSVNPGYSGQKFMPEVLPKITELRKMKPKMNIEIDGGISPATIRQAYDAGANVFVAGSAIFDKPDREKAIYELRSQLPILYTK